MRQGASIRKIVHQMHLRVVLMARTARRIMKARPRARPFARRISMARGLRRFERLRYDCMTGCTTHMAPKPNLTHRGWVTFREHPQCRHSAMELMIDVIAIGEEHRVDRMRYKHRTDSFLNSTSASIETDIVTLFDSNALVFTGHTNDMLWDSAQRRASLPYTGSCENWHWFAPTTSRSRKEVSSELSRVDLPHN